MPAKSIAAEFDRECFFITPIGVAGSPERKRADDTLRAIVEPSADAVGLVTVRADRIDEGGHITLQILEHCTHAKAAVADLTGGNLNVYYEVGIRHALSRPLVLIADESMRDGLPFDLLQQRTVFYSDTLGGAASAQEAVTRQLKRALEGNVDSPVQAAANLWGLQRGDAVQQTLAQLVSQVAELPTALERTATARVGLPRGTRRQIREELEVLETLAGDGDADGQLQQVAQRLRQLLGVARATTNAGDDVVALSQIRALRDEMELSAQELAERSGLDPAALSMIERGQRNPSFSTLARIAAGLNMRLAELIRLGEEDAPDSGAQP
jgi:DNA-binding XRE family transcriptional regulator